MSALVCGKRSFLEDLHSSPPVNNSNKRVRCNSHYSRSSSPDTSLLSQLRSLFPHMDHQFLETTLESCGNDLASAIKSLNELRLQSTPMESNGSVNLQHSTEGSTTEGIGFSCQNSNSHDEEVAIATFPVNGSDWVDLFLREMQTAADMNDARERVSRAFEALEKAIVSRSGSGVENLQKENIALQQQIENVTRDNSILKRAVSIQHERQKEHEEKERELQHLKQLISQYQEQLKTLEINNYALTLHLRQAQQGSSIPGRFNPDVF